MGSSSPSLGDLDRRYIWHPFTQMRDWERGEPVVIASGKGAVLTDTRGRSYIDANASIWTNLHGHRNAAIDRSIRRQLGKIAHSSALGLANEPASLLGQRLAAAANARPRSRRGQPKLTRVFYSDDGSTAMEVALKLAFEFTRRTGRSQHPRFLSLQDAYHGDTVGAVSLGHVDLFHASFRDLLFRSDKVMQPYCYRCPYNRARPERAEARSYRQCSWECVDHVERRFEVAKKRGRPISAMVVEPIIQGVAGMVIHPEGWLRKVASIVRGHDALLIADEVMTGFGRTGGASLFACHREGVQPDLMALAKGMTGGYLPMAATLVTQDIYRAFLGRYDEFKTFFHGHSFTGNQLGSAAALANLELLEGSAQAARRQRLEVYFHQELQRLWALSHVGDVRCVGVTAGVELVRDWTTREAFPWAEQRGIRVCRRMASLGVLTRPIGNVIVLMLPYCTTRAQVRQVINALIKACRAEFEDEGN